MSDVVGGRAPVTMYSTTWCGYCHRLRSQMDREGIEYEVVDIERHPEAAAIVAHHNLGSHTVPTLVYADGTAQTNPPLRAVKAKLDSLGRPGRPDDVPDAPPEARQR